MLEESIAPKSVACANEDKGADRTEARDTRLDSVIGELKEKFEARIDGLHGDVQGIKSRVDGLHGDVQGIKTMLEQFIQKRSSE